MHFFQTIRCTDAMFTGLVAICLFAGLSGTSAGILSAAEDPAKTIQLTYEQQVRPLLETYCFGCHDSKRRKGDLDLSVLRDGRSAVQARPIWRDSLAQVRALDMPPKAEKQPSDQERAVLTDWMLSLRRLDQPDPGRVTVRRLNRSEYDNTIRDLFGIDPRIARDTFPVDDVGEGFDNIGEVLSLPPVLLEKYLDAATAILDKVIVPSPVNISTTAAQLPTVHGAEQLPAETKPGSRDLTAAAEVILNVSVPQAARHTLKIRAGADQAGSDPAMLVVRVDGQVVKDFKVTAKRKQPATLTVTLPLEKGRHRIGLHFANPFTETAAAPPKLRPGQPVPKATATSEPAIRLLSIEKIELAGPPVPAGQGPNKRIFTVFPGPDLSPKDAASRIIEHFATLAFRRPPTKEQVDRLLAVFNRSQEDGDAFEESITYALKMALVSPAFLFRLERDQKATLPNNAYALDDYDLASRLSYFLWSSMPDEELFALAKEQKLHEPSIMEAQVRRLLRDPKAKALAETFAEQWLTLRALDTVEPDAKRFPTFTKDLRQAMQDEAILFFDGIMREDRSLLELIDADYTFVNEKLAKHYGIDGVTGPAMRKVRLTERNRGGVMTMAGVLTATSQPSRTSPVKRGKWVLEQLLGDPPPPPPAAVPKLPEKGESGTAGKSLRQLLERHRVDPGCASCHLKMDTIGFGLENYDAIGRWRTSDDDAALDVAGMLPGGIAFSGPVQLKEVFLKRKDTFLRNLTAKMLTFALGRGLGESDDVVIEQIAASLEKDGFRASSLITRIATSFPFTHRRLP